MVGGTQQKAKLGRIKGFLNHSWTYSSAQLFFLNFKHVLYKPNQNLAYDSLEPGVHAPRQHNGLPRHVAGLLRRQEADNAPHL